MRGVERMKTPPTNKKQKIVCVGLPKTGTLSLCHALKKLGFSTKHGGLYSCSEEKIKKVLNKKDAIVEIYGLIDFEKIKEWFPDARLIWTKRKLETWLVSCEKQFGHHRKISEYIKHGRERRFGQAYFDEEFFKEIFLNFNKRVEDYKALRPSENILEMDITKGDGYEKLCPFLDVPLPFPEFPHKNKSHAKKPSR